MIQLKLLRVLQEKEFDRVGESKPRKVDVRVIATTNRNLKEAITEGKFREDLYYRLNVIEVKLPPLRERYEDIPLLIDHFSRVFNKSYDKNIDGVSDEVLEQFIYYPWPGNVRELEHAIERAFVLCRNQTIQLEHIPTAIRDYTRIKERTLIKRTDDDPDEILSSPGKDPIGTYPKTARLFGHQPLDDVSSI